MSAIAEVEAIPLRARVNPGDLDSSSETLVVRLTDEDGRTGIGEADGPADAVRRLVLMEDVHAWSRGLRNVLLGRDPREPGVLWQELYEATIWHGRSGLGIHALSAWTWPSTTSPGSSSAAPCTSFSGAPAASG